LIFLAQPEQSRQVTIAKFSDNPEYHIYHLCHNTPPKLNQIHFANAIPIGLRPLVLAASVLTSLPSVGEIA
jgi:hypothetical protein